MSLTKEDLKAISDLLDEKLDQKLDEKLDQKLDQKLDEKLAPVNKRLDKMDGRLDKMEGRIKILEVKQDRTAKKLEDLQLDIKIFERDIRGDIHQLSDEVETVIEILRVNELMPR